MSKETASDEGGWLLIGLDEKMARRQGLPARIPVPKGEFEGLADKGLNVDRARGWVKDFTCHLCQPKPLKYLGYVKPRASASARKP